MASVARPREARTGAHAAAGPRPPPEPPKATTPGNGPGPAGRANMPRTPGSRTSVTVAPAASQSRWNSAVTGPPAVSARNRVVTGPGGVAAWAAGPAGVADHHRPNGSVPV